MALTLKISKLLYELHNEAMNQAEGGDLTDAMAAKIIRTIRELGFNFEGREIGEYRYSGSEESP